MNWTPLPSPVPSWSPLTPLSSVLGDPQDHRTPRHSPGHPSPVVDRDQHPLLELGLPTPAFLCIFPKSRIKKCAFVSYFVDFEKLIFLKLEKLYFK